MTVKELIRMLEKVEDKEATVYLDDSEPCVTIMAADVLKLLKEQQETIELQGSLLTLAHAAMNQKRKKDKD